MFNLSQQLAEAVGQDIVRGEMVGAFVQLLKDNEAEVRTAGAGQIPGETRTSYIENGPNECLYQVSPNFSRGTPFFSEYYHV